MTGPNRSFIVWLHGMGDSGSPNEFIKTHFTSLEFRSTKWSFPSADRIPVTCNRGHPMPSWFDIYDRPINFTPGDPKVDQIGLFKAVKDVHAMIDQEIAEGTDPANVFVCGLSQGGALAVASVLLYPKTLGGGAVFSGYFPFNSSFAQHFPEDAKKTPILWLYGMEDTNVSLEIAQAGPLLLQMAGVACEFKAFPGLGHIAILEELTYLETWIKSRLPSLNL